MLQHAATKFLYVVLLTKHFAATEGTPKRHKEFYFGAYKGILLHIECENGSPTPNSRLVKQNYATMRCTKIDDRRQAHLQ